MDIILVRTVNVPLLIIHFLQNIADIVSNVLDENNKAAFTATNEVPVANQTTESAAILRTTEGIANGVGRALTPSKPIITLSRPNFGMTTILTSPCT